MGPATERSQNCALHALLAGLQGGMLGACAMLLWLGLSSMWQSRSFWTAGNLMASVFYGARALHGGFTFRTLSGLALYLLLYSSLGALFALALGGRLSRQRTFLLSLVFAMGWYYFSYHLVWRSAIPLVALLHAERPTVLGHLIYGSFLGRYPAHMEAETELRTAAVPETDVPQSLA